MTYTGMISESCRTNRELPGALACPEAWEAKPMERRNQPRVLLLPVLIAGFSLLVLMLAASVYIEVDAIRSTESGAARLVEGQRSTLRLIDEIQREEESLSAVFYELAT